MASDTDKYQFWRYDDLVERRIIGDRNDLHRKQYQQGFPKPVRLARGTRAAALFRVAEVMAWVDSNAMLGGGPKMPGRPRKQRPETGSVQPDEAA